MMRSNGGFTLVELMVALAVFAVVAVTVFTRSSDTLSQLASLEERLVAHWIAENELATLRMSRLATDEPMATGTESHRVAMADREWQVSVSVDETANPSLRRIEVDVEKLDSDGVPGRPEHLVGFVGRY